MKSVGSFLFSLFFCFCNCLYSIELSVEEEALVKHVQVSLERAERGISKLSPEVVQIHGYSSPTVRHFLNNLCSLPNTFYLEIGCWKGSTFVPALYGNESSISQAFAVDDWSQFDGSRAIFLANLEAFIPNAHFQLCETNCFALDKKQTFSAPINIFFYDGAHDENSQASAFTYFKEIFDHIFIAVVDDWNWSDVRTGTYRGLRKAGLEILFEKQLFTYGNGDINSWWNGLYVAVLRNSHE